MTDRGIFVFSGVEGVSAAAEIIARSMKCCRAAILSFVVATCLWQTNAMSAELVMFEAADCSWCARWNAEVGIIYAKTEEGREFRLRRVDIHAERPADLAWIKRITFTPTFVLVDNGREIGRVTGYPGEDHFWGLLEVLRQKRAAAANGE